ncbi:MAG: hypothetical protein LBL18_01705 [Bacteroidales bacterium]|jgi:hypothetical protein|nr:hypothetical protein [Bacteroidales bacterium]
MIKKLLLAIPVMAAIVLIAISCHRNPAQEQIKKLKELSLAFAKDSLKLEADSVQIVKIDTLTQLGYAKITLEMLENLDEQYQLNYHKALLAQNDVLITEMETYLQQVRELKQNFISIVDNATVDDKKAFLYMYQANFWRSGGIFEAILFAMPNYKFHDLDPFSNNLLEKSTP